MKTLIITLLLSVSPLALSEDMILTIEGLTCSDTKTGRPFPLEHNVAVQIPNHCLDIPWTIEAYEDYMFKNDSYNKVEYRLPLSLSIKHAGQTISCYSNSKEVKRLSKYDFTIADNAIIKRDISDKSTYNSGDFKTAAEHRKHDNRPSHEKQNLSFQIYNNSIVVAQKYLDGKSPFGYYHLDNSPEVASWYMKKSAKNINMKAFAPVKEDLNFASSVDCGEEVLNESISDYGLQKQDNDDNSQKSNSIKQ